MFEDYSVEPGKIVKVFSVEETKIIESDWLSVFCKNKQGLNTKAFKWHIFSGSGYPSIDGECAITQYKAQVGTEFIVLPNDNGVAILTDKLPSQCDLSDYYVFPPNFAWVMAFTHEEGWLGPYFAKHKDYEKLNKDNIVKVEKERQKQIAKEKGWY